LYVWLLVRESLDLDLWIVDLEDGSRIEDPGRKEDSSKIVYGPLELGKSNENICMPSRIADADKSQAKSRTNR
jgi:hypothetical protein